VRSTPRLEIVTRRTGKAEHRVDGRLVVITGATAGIGRAAALMLARRGAKLSLVCRNRAKGETVVAEIERSAPGASADIVECDLADLDSVRRAAAELRERYVRIEVLINNAGVHAVAPRRAGNGFDQMLACNYLGPFLLTNLLLERIRPAAPARILVVASEAHRLAGRLDPEDFENLGHFGWPGSFRAYGRTKLLDVLFAAELARRLDGTGVSVNSLDPGTVATNLYGQLSALAPIVSALSHTPLVRTAEQGAETIVRLASDPALEGTTGRFFTATPGLGLLPPVRARRDTRLQRRLWERTAELVGLGA